MSEQSHTVTSSTENGLTIERVFDAPREMVFRAWTEPEQFARWYGPNGFTTPFCALDARVGGRLHFSMSGGDHVMWIAGVYRAVEPPAQLEFSIWFADESGNKVAAEVYGVPGDFPDETVVRVTLEELRDGKTKMTVFHGLPEYMAGDAGQGWNQSFDKMAAMLAQGQE